MSEPENFLARWSRRKAEGEQAAERAPNTTAGPESQEQPGDVAAEAKANEEGEKVDLSKLPPIESIGPETDIRAFLQKGIPPELTKAALRQVWTSDPAIRNFIGIAENQYDFATGSDIPGFGPLSPADDVAGMVSRIMREGVPRDSLPAQAEPSLEPAEEPPERPTPVAQVAAETTSEAVSAEAEEHGQSPSDGAVQHGEGGEEDSSTRSHGGALPR